MSVKIISDSTCDLSQELIERYDVQILPLHVVLGDEEYLDGVTITPDEIYTWADANKTTPKTSALGIDSTIEAFKPWIEAGDEIVCFAISGDMSTTVNVMRMAAQELEAEDRIFVIDSMNLSSGVGLLVVEAAELARQGKSGKEIADYVNALRPRVRASFVVDSLTYLHRGGRCSGAAALAGSALKLHPRIAVADGKMAPGKKYRGKMSKVILEYVKDMEADMLRAKPDRVFLTHSGCDEALLSEIRSYLESLSRFNEILTCRAGAVISSHCGPGTLGVLFIDGE